MAPRAQDECYTPASMPSRLRMTLSPAFSHLQRSVSGKRTGAPGLRGALLRILLCLGSCVSGALAQQGATLPAPGPQVGSIPPSTTLAAQVDALLASPASARAHWGISVVDAGTGASLYARNDGQLFQPASNAKLFTTAAALALLGPGYTFRTTVMAEGVVSPDGHLHGTLRLVGGGDPTLSGRTYPYAGRTERNSPPLHWLDDLAAQVAASGIREADLLVADDTLFPWERYGTGWAWDDLQWDYGAAVSALTVADNVEYLNVAPGARVGEPVQVSWQTQPDSRTVAPGTPVTEDGGRRQGTPDTEQATRDPLPLVTATTSAAGTEAHLGVSREVEDTRLRVFGTLPAGARPLNLAIAVHDPADYARLAFADALDLKGIKIDRSDPATHRASVDTMSFAAETHVPVVLRPPGAAPPAESAVAGTRVVATRISPPLREIVTVTNKVSQNLHAELLLHTLGRVQGDDGSAAQGVRVVRQFLVSAGIDPRDFTFVDGSGLSPQDLITPRATTTLLVYAARQGWGADYRSSLPVGGVDGTLAGRFTQPPLKGFVVAKTGTLAEVNTLSGYLTAASGRTLAFSILCNSYVGEGSRATIDKVVGALAASF